MNETRSGPAQVADPASVRVRSPTAAILEARNVSKLYRAGTAQEIRALDDVSVTVAVGGFCVLRGASGSGKTTLLALLGALERPSSGHIIFQERELGRCSDTELSRVRRHMGFVFQDFSLIPGLCAWENVAYPLIPRGIRQAHRRARAETILTQLGLQDRIKSRPPELSGGEQQRVALARALVADPDIILADEPTSNLDPEAAATVLATLHSLHTAGKTIVLATHDPGMAQHATHVHELRAGRRVENG